MLDSIVVRARWVFPVAQPPITWGAVEIGPNGRIAAVHREAHSLSQAKRIVDLGGVALVPGLVNAHTHLEFSDLTEPLLPARPFSAWLTALIAYRRRRGQAWPAVERGVEECRRSGTAGVGEIVTYDLNGQQGTDDDEPTTGSFASSSNSIWKSIPRAVLFREMIAVSNEATDEQLDKGRRFLDSIDCRPGRQTIPGLSPHAPYSVHPRLLEQAVVLAARRQAPVSIHLAETREELDLLREQSGELVEFLSGLGVWTAGMLRRGTRPLDYLRTLVALGHVVIAHGNYLDDEEIAFVSTHQNFAVAYCPRTHAFFGHAEHPWRRLVARGGVVAIGTDGRGSNPDLSVWNELLFLHVRHPDVDPAILLQMGTINGARALGLESDLGTLELGKLPQAAVIRLGEDGGEDPYAALFHPHSRVEGLLDQRVSNLCGDELG